MWLLVIQVIVFLSYVVGIVSRYGVLESISDSWYSLPLKYNGLFTLFTWGLGIPMLIYVLWVLPLVLSWVMVIPLLFISRVLWLAFLFPYCISVSLMVYGGRSYCNFRVPSLSLPTTE